MYELNKNDFSVILPLLVNSKQEVLPFSIAQGINPGRIFGDDKKLPNIVLIWTTVGYYFLFGDPELANLSKISQTLSEIFVPASKASGESGFILIPSTNSWKSTISTILPEQKVIEIFRTPHELDLQKFNKEILPKVSIPAGFEILKLDSDLAEKIGILASWSTIDDFLTNGIGYTVMNEGQLASYCYSVFSSQQAIEIDVHTVENFRGLGLATLVCSTLMQTCILNGKKPNWECFKDNSTSLKLAAKLGYSAKNEYPVYFWEND